MCGKFTQMMSWRALHALADLVGAGDAADEVQTVTPMRFAAVIRLDGAGRREVVPMRCGLVDRRSKTPLERPKHMHARAETIDTLPTFRDAFAHARGLVVVKTFNEGEEISPTKTLQHTITPNDGKPLAIAVVFEEWVNRSEGSLLTFCMVTTPANALIARVTDRMPAIIKPEDWAKWLGETPASLSEIKALLVPYEGDWTMRAQAKDPQKPKRPPRQPDLF